MRAIARTFYYRLIALIARLLTPFKRSRYLGAAGPKKLQIGAGTTIAPGWLVTDLEPSSLAIGYLDATKPFPFPTASFDYVHSEHMIEHVPWAGGQAMLRECLRVLKPGGRIRIATPDLKVLLDLYGAKRGDAYSIRYVEWMTRLALPDAPAADPIFVINLAVRAWGHQFLYDAHWLTEALKLVGFVDIRQYAPGASDDPALRGIEKHGDFVGDEWVNQFETMVFEARRP